MRGLMKHERTGNTRFIQLSKWGEHHSWPPPGGLRHLRFYCRSNGFEGAFVKVGRTVLVDETEFWRVCRRLGHQESPDNAIPPAARTAEGADEGGTS